MFDIDPGTATSLSVTLLIIGIGMTVIPFVAMKTKELGHDHFIGALIVTLLAIAIFASQAIYLVRRFPDLLYPLVIITLGFRMLSPSIFVTTLREKYEKKRFWNFIQKFLVLVALGLVFYTFISGMTAKSNENLAVSDKFLMTVAVAYTYARAYLRLVRKFFFDWEEGYILVSGLLIGISFVILIPFLLDEFDRAYKLTGTVGWLGAFLVLYTGRALSRKGLKKRDGSDEVDGTEMIDGEKTEASSEGSDERDVDPGSPLY